MELTAAIPDGAAVFIDTAPVVYVLEGHALAARFAPVFRDIDAGRIRAVVTPVTVAEVVAGPLRAGKEALAERYRRALTDNAGWHLCLIDADLAVLAARLRIRHGLRLPDALQLAAAVTTGCHALLTHDRDFRSVTDLPILGLGAGDEFGR